MIVAHPAVLKLIYAYVKGIPREQAPDIDIPPHSVVYLGHDGASAMVERHYDLGPPRPRVSSAGSAAFSSAGGAGVQLTHATHGVLGSRLSLFRDMQADLFGKLEST